MRVKNWEKFQHYTPMNPRFQKKMTWFKVYGDDLLNDPDFMVLSDECQAMLAKCWCLASRKNGELPDIDGIAFALRKDKSFVIKTLSKLQGWLEGDCYQTASIEKEKEKEKEKEISIVHFDTFWSLYPKKVAKDVCLQKWKSRKLDKIGEKIINHVKAMKETKQWKDSTFIPMPLTYINQSRWEAEREIKRNIWDGGI